MGDLVKVIAVAHWQDCNLEQENDHRLKILRLVLESNCFFLTFDEHWKIDVVNIVVSFFWEVRVVVMLVMEEEEEEKEKVKEG